MRPMLRWLHANLFYSPFASILTILCGYLLYLFVPPLITWLIINATFSGNDPLACTLASAATVDATVPTGINSGFGAGTSPGSGACWVFIKIRFNQFMYGFYPVDQQWRINISYIFGLILLGILLLPKVPGKKYIASIAVIIYPISAFILFYGGIFGLTTVATALWGGLHVTLVIAVTGIMVSLPLGILLALGRRSTLPALRVLCTMFIELWRGVPLISVLFMASVMLPLFLPENINFDKLLRALIGVALFSSAYMAEVVRGGLQAIPHGQYEAARSLGLNYWQTTLLIILPQALKIVIPGIVNTFIGLFKDTTLVVIIGLFDLLGMVQAANTDPKWLAYNIEGYLFAGFGFWIFCFSMSRYSMYLERRLRSR